MTLPEIPEFLLDSLIFPEKKTFCQLLPSNLLMIQMEVTFSPLKRSRIKHPKGSRPEECGDFPDFFSGKAPLEWAIDPTKHVVPGILPSMDFLKAMIPGGSTGGARWVRAIPRCHL